MTERKFVSDKRILAYNPFEDVEEKLSSHMYGYSFLDFLKLNRAVCTLESFDISRDTEYMYSMSHRNAIGVKIGDIHWDGLIRIYLVDTHQRGSYFFEKGDKND